MEMNVLNNVLNLNNIIIVINYVLKIVYQKRKKNSMIDKISNVKYVQTNILIVMKLMIMYVLFVWNICFKVINQV